MLSVECLSSPLRQGDNRGKQLYNQKFHVVDMMFIPLKWTLKRHIYGPIMDHMNSRSTVSTQYGNHSIYCPYGVPIVPIMSLKVDIFLKISTFRCRYDVLVVHIWFIFEKKILFFSIYLFSSNFASILSFVQAAVQS